MNRELTTRESDCLFTIERLTSGGWAARVKDIAEEMRVSPPTAVEYLVKLSDAGLVEKGVTGYRLSAEGTRSVDRLIRVHRLFETLLFRAGMSIDEAHRISSSVDRHVGANEAAVLCAKLNHPKTCPHDRPIPAGDEFD
jgi:DtxR family Mn-dependent transcriptional regulator